MNYEYQAIDHDGGIVRGIIKANSPEKVLQILLHKQLHPLEIQPLTESTVELSRLNQLKQRLQKKPDMEEKPVERKTSEPPKPKKEIDWTYVLFFLFMAALIVAAASAL
jgi:type II secretory pathway component PulF